MVLLAWLKTHWLRVVVHIGSLLPLAWLVWRAAQGLFVVDPVREITAVTGTSALVLLILSLACTPISTLSGYTRVLQVRRALGMYSFLYVALHFLTFVGLDYGFDAGLLREALFEQRYVVAGLAAGVMLSLLALTSTRGSQRRLKKNWKRLHRLVYPAAALAVVHFLWLSKDWREPLRYGLLLAVLLGLRLPWVRTGLSRAVRWVRLSIRRRRGIVPTPR